MKKIILSVMLAMFCQVAFCQTSYNHNGAHHASGKDKTPEERADMHVKRMTQDLALSPEQALKVKAITLDKIKKAEAIKTKYASATDHKEMHKEMKALRDQKENELKAALTPEQYAKHLQLNEEHKKVRMQHAHGEGRTSEERTDMHLKKMKEALTLTDQQVPKIRAIILDKNQKIEAVKTKYANSTDKKAMHEEMKMINDQKENELKAMLTPEQYAKHVQLKEEQKKKRMEKQKE